MSKNQYIALTDLCYILKVDHSVVYDLWRSGALPKPVSTKGAPFFARDDIEALAPFIQRGESIKAASMDVSRLELQLEQTQREVSATGGVGGGTERLAKLQADAKAARDRLAELTAVEPLPKPKSEIYTEWTQAKQNLAELREALDAKDGQPTEREASQFFSAKRQVSQLQEQLPMEYTHTQEQLDALNEEIFNKIVSHQTNRDKIAAQLRENPDDRNRRRVFDQLEKELPVLREQLEALPKKAADGPPTDTVEDYFTKPTAAPYAPPSYADDGAGDRLAQLQHEIDATTKELAALERASRMAG